MKERRHIGSLGEYRDHHVRCPSQWRGLERAQPGTEYSRRYSLNSVIAGFLGVLLLRKSLNLGLIKTQSESHDSLQPAAPVLPVSCIMYRARLIDVKDSKGTYPLADVEEVVRTVVLIQPRERKGENFLRYLNNKNPQS